MWKQLVMLAAAGAAGTLCRYGLAVSVERICGARFPWGTLLVNTSGCFLFGVVWMLTEQRMLIPPQVRFVLLTGFMGAFTTFSTLAFDTTTMLQDARWWPAAANSIGHLALGVLFVLLGFAAGRQL